MRLTNAGRRNAATALALGALTMGIGACGGDDESTDTVADTAATTSSTTTVTEDTTSTTDTSAPATGGDYAAAADALEADGFDVEERPESELTQSAGLPKPITATAGAVLTRSGSSGDVLLYEFASTGEAESYAKANNDSILTTEVVGTLTLTSTSDNTDLLDQALAAIG